MSSLLNYGTGTPGIAPTSAGATDVAASAMANLAKPPPEPNPFLAGMASAARGYVLNGPSGAIGGLVNQTPPIGGGGGFSMPAPRPQQPLIGYTPPQQVGAVAPPMGGGASQTDHQLKIGQLIGAALAFL